MQIYFTQCFAFSLVKANSPIGESERENATESREKARAKAREKKSERERKADKRNETESERMKARRKREERGGAINGHAGGGCGEESKCQREPCISHSVQEHSAIQNLKRT